MAMKRTAEESTFNDPKRIKLDYESEDLFADGLEKNALNISQNGTDGSGYISARAFMLWPPTPHKLRINIEATTSASPHVKHRFDAEISGNCVPFFDKFRFDPQDTFQIALRGAKMENTKKSSAPTSIPMKLTYEEGVVIKWIKRSKEKGQDGMIVDVWKLQEKKSGSEPSEDDWFSTPLGPSSKRRFQLPFHRISTISPIPEFQGNSTPPRSICVPIVQDHSNIPSLPPDGRETSSGTRTPIPAPAHHNTPQPNQQSRTPPQQPSETPRPQRPVSQPPYDQKPGQKLTKRATRRRRKKLAAMVDISTTKSSVSALAPATVLAPSVAPAVQALTAAEPTPPPVLPPATTETATTAFASSSSHLSRVAQSPPQSLPPTPESHPTSTPLPDSGVYSHLRDVTAKRQLDIIAVVSNNPVRSVEKKHTGDWSLSLRILDPTNYNTQKGSEDCGMLLNCFSKYKEWAPQVRYGDVVIFRNVKTTDFNSDVVGTGYKDKLRWAVYDPVTHAVTEPVLGDAPRRESINPEGGTLVEWWDTMKKEEEKAGNECIVYQIGDADTYKKTKKKRVHRLICDAGPDEEPNGFFDCTVEVVFGHQNDNGIYSLYVTDYTSHPLITPITASWCPPYLIDRVLKIEMWHQASEKAKELEVGQYYFIGNNRMKVSRGGYVEGTVSQFDKIRRIEDEEDDRLKALLLRKKALEDGSESSLGSSSAGVEERLIKNFTEDKFYNCTVEVLHAASGGTGSSYLFVTDYTRHKYACLLPDGAVSMSACNLHNRVLKISLRDAQAEILKSIEIGSFYHIKKLRLKKSTARNEYLGLLGGEERLIHKIRTNGSLYDPLKELLLRKEQCKPGMTSPSHGTEHINGASSNHTSPLVALRCGPCTSVEKIKNHEQCPNQFRVIARIVDFYPLRLEECVVLRCTKCKEQLPATRRRCLNCDDMADSYVKCYYRFFFLLEDQGGDRLDIIVTDPELSILRGLPPVDLHDNQHALDQFKERLTPVLGNLVEVHDGILSGQFVAVDSPDVVFIIDSWQIKDDGTRGYCLVDYILL